MVTKHPDCIAINTISDCMSSEFSWVIVMIFIKILLYSRLMYEQTHYITKFWVTLIYANLYTHITNLHTSPIAHVDGI